MIFSRTWLGPISRYLGASTFLHLVWEILQLPLYTLWTEGSIGARAIAVAHCTVGDVMIAGFSLVASLLILADPEWPDKGHVRVASAAMVLGLTYTVFSEWLNVNVRGAWAYAAEMPRVPPLGTGLSPLAQWLIVPPLALNFAYQRARR